MPKRIRQSEEPADTHAEPNADAFMPDVDVAAGVQQRPPQIGEALPFQYKHRHTDWTVMGGRVIPRLTKIKHQGGINGADVTKDGRVVVRHVVSAARERGETPIPYDVDGPGTSYLRKVEGTNLVVSRWEKTYPGSSQIGTDVEGYVTFCRGLITKGVIAPPPVYILEKMEADHVRQIEELAGKHGVETIAKRLISDLEAIRVEIAAQNAAASPARDTVYSPEAS